MLHKNKEKSGGGKRGVTKKRLSLRNLRGATRGEWGIKKGEWATRFPTVWAGGRQFAVSKN
jgi:hypothetical protein